MIKAWSTLLESDRNRSSMFSEKFDLPILWGNVWFGKNARSSHVRPVDVSRQEEILLDAGAVTSKQETGLD